VATQPPAAAPPPKTKPAPKPQPRKPGGDRIKAEPRKPKPKPAPPKPTVYQPKKSGDIAWQYPIPGAEERSAIRSCPAVDHRHRLYVAMGKTLFALAEGDGVAKVLWEFPTPAHIPGSPSLGPDGLIRVHSMDKNLYFVTEDGEEGLSPVELQEPLGWASPLADDDANTWVNAYSGGLLKVDSGGETKRNSFFRTRQKFDSTGFIYKGVYYVGSEDGFVYAISISGMRGRITWDHLKGQGKTDWFINSAPAMSPAPSIIIAGRDEHLYAFGMNGKKTWKVHLRGQMLASPVVSPEGDVYVGVSTLKYGKRGQGRLVCVGGEPHKIKWEFKASGAIESTPVVGEDGLIYFGDNAGSIHCITPEGERQWLANVGSPVRSAGTIYKAGRVVFGCDNGTLVAVQCSSQGLASGGWPKYMGTLGQSGTPAV